MLRWNWNEVFARIVLHGTTFYYDLMIGNCFAVIATPQYGQDGKPTGNRTVRGDWISKPSADLLGFFFDEYLSDNYIHGEDGILRSVKDIIVRIEIKFDEYHERFDDEDDHGRPYNELDQFIEFLNSRVDLKDKVVKVSEFSIDDFGKAR